MTDSTNDLIRKRVLKSKGYIDKNMRDIITSLNSKDEYESSQAHSIGACAIILSAFLMGEIIEVSHKLGNEVKTWKECRAIIIDNICNALSSSDELGVNFEVEYIH